MFKRFYTSLVNRLSGSDAPTKHASHPQDHDRSDDDDVDSPRDRGRRPNKNRDKNRDNYRNKGRAKAKATKRQQDMSDPPKDHPIATLSREEHGLSRKQMSEKALSVVYGLRRAGFDAYLVGGCIRDLMLGGQPKDFDVATNATPEQVKQQFKWARIVGRRFKIAHVSYGREIIEVTTFRAAHQDADSAKTSHGANRTALANDQGMLLRDNVYGSLREDALRRDFSINALYYTVDQFQVLDYVGGIDDLRNRVIRIIGDAETRYSEDPVRLLRAIRFKAKLGFEFDPATAEPIARCGPLLNQVAAPRLFDEIIKLFLHGNGRATLELLFDYDLFRQLFPFTEQALSSDDNNANQASRYRRLLQHALDNTDQRIAQRKPVTPAFLYAALLWPVVAEHSDQLVQQGETKLRSLQLAGFAALDAQLPIVTIPKRFSIAMREIWNLQSRLENARLDNRQHKRTLALLDNPRFRAAYDFLLLREQAGEALQEYTDYWTKVQEEQGPRVKDRHGRPRANDKSHPKRRRRKHRGKSETNSQSTTSRTSADHSAAEDPRRQ